MIGVIRRIKGSGSSAQLWRRAWFASALIAGACVIAHTHSTRMVPKSSDDVLTLAFEQRALTQRIVLDALVLDDAITDEDYASLSALLAALRSDASEWSENHERLSGFVSADLSEPIARMSNPHTQLRRGLDELLIVGSSAERRAPYLDLGTARRISRASELLVHSEGFYSEGLEQITSRRQELIDERIERFRASSRSALLFVMLLVLALPPIVVLPVAGLLRSPMTKRASSDVVARIGTEEDEKERTSTQLGAGRRAA